MLKNIEGMDGFITAVGRVEDRFDPLFLGRCRVRYLYWHTKDKQEIPTEELPWSYPLLSLDSGKNVVGPQEADWVLSFFRDGEKAQFPVMLGILPGYCEEVANPALGFNDPRPASLLAGHKVPRDCFPPVQHDDGSGTEWDERDPKSRFPETRYLFESTFHRLGRAEKIDETIVEQKRENRFVGQIDIPNARHPAGTGTDEPSPGDVFSEPKIPYEAKYPYNHVYYSEGGHIIEIDDTPNHERIHIYHRLGSFIEIHPTGMKVSKTVQDEFNIVLKNKFEHIEASKQETVDWNQKTYVNKDRLGGFNYDQTVGEGGNFNITTEGGKVNIYCNGDINAYATGDITTKSEKNTNMIVEKDLNVDVKGNYNLKVAGNRSETVGKLAVTVAGTISDVSKTVCVRGAVKNICDTAPTVSHNAELTSCTAQLLGITLDDDGDLTPAGPAGHPPINAPGFPEIPDENTFLDPPDQPVSIESMLPDAPVLDGILAAPLEIIYAPQAILTNPLISPSLSSMESFLDAVGGVPGLVTLSQNVGSSEALGALVSSIGTTNFAGFLSAMGGIEGISQTISSIGGIDSLIAFTNATLGQTTSIISEVFGTIEGVVNTVSQLSGDIQNLTSLITTIGSQSFSQTIASLGGMESVLNSISQIGGFENFMSVVSTIGGDNLVAVLDAVGGLDNLPSFITSLGDISSVNDVISVIGGSEFAGLADLVGGQQGLNQFIYIAGSIQNVISLVNGVKGGTNLQNVLTSIGGLEGLSNLITSLGGFDAAKDVLSGIAGGYGPAFPTK